MKYLIYLSPAPTTLIFLCIVEQITSLFNASQLVQHDAQACWRGFSKRAMLCWNMEILRTQRTLERVPWRGSLTHTPQLLVCKLMGLISVSQLISEEIRDKSLKLTGVYWSSSWKLWVALRDRELSPHSAEALVVKSISQSPFRAEGPVSLLHNLSLQRCQDDEKNLCTQFWGLFQSESGKPPFMHPLLPEAPAAILTRRNPYTNSLVHFYISWST